MMAFRKLEREEVVKNALVTQWKKPTDSLLSVTLRALVYINTRE